LRLFVAILILVIFSGCAVNEQSRKNAEAHYMLGVSYLRADDATHALNELLMAEAIEADNALLQAALGQAYHTKKAYVESELHYLKALKLDKDNPKYQNNLAALYLEMQRWDEAITYFYQAASNLLFSQPEVAWTGYGYAYFMKGDYLKAIDAYIKAINYNSRYAQAFVRRGEAFHSLDQAGKAIADYQHALELFPNYSLAHYNMAVSYMKLRQVGLAVKHFNQVVQIAPESDLALQAKSYLLVLK